MTTPSIRGSSSAGRSAPHRWLSEITSVAPFSLVKSSIAQIALTPWAFRGRGTLQKLSSKCSGCCA